jgi:ACS family tartrate transporter-like MFS transporter
VLFVTAIATFLDGRRTGVGKVPSGSHANLSAKEAAAFDLPAEELHHSHDEDIAGGRSRSRDGEHV